MQSNSVKKDFCFSSNKNNNATILQRSPNLLMSKNLGNFAINERGEMYFKRIVIRRARVKSPDAAAKAAMEAAANKPQIVEPGMILLSDLLQCLVECSEKAAKIAQIFRDENDLFDVLIQEKCQSESNKRFAHDFKTLADVLVQETIKKDVGEKFPDLIPNIQGEEQNTFKNSQGESVVVELTESSETTVNMLNRILDGRKQIARAVADIVYSRKIVCERQSCSRDTVKTSKLGIWIDPIDSTAEFIEGNYDETEECGMQPYGLKCVCVLIGVYDKDTHNPILGVINQPFHYKESEEAPWKSKFYWGINNGEQQAISYSIPEKHEKEATAPVTNADGMFFGPWPILAKDKFVVISTSEQPGLQEIINKRYTIVHAAGAGHKALLVAIEKADLYVLSRGTTYFWDTCGPHAILNALGGGILRFDAAVNDIDRKDLDFLKRKQLSYQPRPLSKGIKLFQNSGGIIAYRNPYVVIRFINHLVENGYIAR